MQIIKVVMNDLISILNLQKMAYLSEAELVNDFSIPPLTQNIEGIINDFNRGRILKAVIQDTIIGSVRGVLIDDTLYIGKLIVHPNHQNQGIGTKLLLKLEEEYPNVYYELFTSDKSNKNLMLYIKIGYKEFKRERVNDNYGMVYLKKINQDKN